MLLLLLAAPFITEKDKKLNSLLNGHFKKVKMSLMNYGTKGSNTVRKYFCQVIAV